MTKQKHFYLFRGLIRESRHWGQFPHDLREAFPGSLVSTIDIPGAGDYFQSPSPLSIKEMVEHMRLEYLKLKVENEEPILIAMSLGGMIAGQWLKDYQQDFSRAILINTSYGGISPLLQRLNPRALAHLLSVPFLKGRHKEAHILKLVLNHKHVFDRNLDLWEAIQRDRPVSLKNTFRQLAAGAMFKIGDFKPAIPVLILASPNDRMVSISCSRAIAKAWSATIIEHPTAGHDLTADDPEWIAEKIKTVC